MGSSSSRERYPIADAPAMSSPNLSSQSSREPQVSPNQPESSTSSLAEYDRLSALAIEAAADQLKLLDEEAESKTRGIHIDPNTSVAIYIVS